MEALRHLLKNSSKNKGKGRPVTCHNWLSRGSRGIAVLFPNFGDRWGGVSRPYIPRPF
jgi:hypothetical protein